MAIKLKFPDLKPVRFRRQRIQPNFDLTSNVPEKLSPSALSKMMGRYNISFTEGGSEGLGIRFSSNSLTINKSDFIGPSYAQWPTAQLLNNGSPVTLVPGETMVDDLLFYQGMTVFNQHVAESSDLNYIMEWMSQAVGQSEIHIQGNVINLVSPSDAVDVALSSFSSYYAYLMLIFMPLDAQSELDMRVILSPVTVTQVGDNWNPGRLIYSQEFSRDSSRIPEGFEYDNYWSDGTNLYLTNNVSSVKFNESSDDWDPVTIQGSSWGEVYHIGDSLIRGVNRKIFNPNELSWSNWNPEGLPEGSVYIWNTNDSYYINVASETYKLVNQAWELVDVGLHDYGRVINIDGDIYTEKYQGSGSKYDLYKFDESTQKFILICECPISDGEWWTDGSHIYRTTWDSGEQISYTYEFNKSTNEFNLVDSMTMSFTPQTNFKLMNSYGRLVGKCSLETNNSTHLYSSATPNPNLGDIVTQYSQYYSELMVKKVP